MRETYAERFRELAEHLEHRNAAPSLDGYALVDGLRAAAALLAEEPGPEVHLDLAGTDVFPPRVHLTDLTKGKP